MEHVARIEDIRSAFRIVVGKVVKEETLWETQV